MVLRVDRCERYAAAAERGHPIDGDGFKGEASQTLFSYAHPLFWAPYSIIGDGGGQ